MKKIVKDALVLFAITLVAGILLCVVYQITLDPFAKANENAKEKAYKAVLAEADSFETIDALPSDDDINASSDIDFSKDKVNEVAIGKKGIYCLKAVCFCKNCFVSLFLSILISLCNRIKCYLIYNTKKKAKEAA